MKELIGMNLMCYAVALIVIFLSDLKIKDKILGMLFVIVFMATLSTGVYLLVGV